MKFAYIDESGSTDEGDFFVMAGIVIDAYRLRKCTTTFDELIHTFLSKHPSSPKELKTKTFIAGRSGWSKIAPDERKEFLKKLCILAAEYSEVFVYALSFDKILAADTTKLPVKSYWLSAAMFVSSSIQKQMRKISNNKGNTVLVFDDNEKEMKSLSSILSQADEWFDGLYQTQVKKRGKTIWQPMSKHMRFDQIINTAFAIKSEHSSLVQVADAVSYVYRRHLEILSAGEDYPGEKEYYDSLLNILNPKRKKLGRTPHTECTQFYKQIACNGWIL